MRENRGIFFIVAVIVVRLYYCSVSAAVRVEEGTALKSETFINVGSLSNTSAVPFGPLRSNLRTNVFGKLAVIAAEHIFVICYFMIIIICILTVRKK